MKIKKNYQLIKQNVIEFLKKQHNLKKVKYKGFSLLNLLEETELLLFESVEIETKITAVLFQNRIQKIISGSDSVIKEDNLGTKNLMFDCTKNIPETIDIMFPSEISNVKKEYFEKEISGIDLDISKLMKNFDQFQKSMMGSFEIILKEKEEGIKRLITNIKEKFS